MFKSTTIFFNMKKEDLRKFDLNSGNTIEETKLLNLGKKVSLYKDFQNYNMFAELDIEEHKEEMNLIVKDTLIMTDGRIAVIYI